MPQIITTNFEEVHMAGQNVVACKANVLEGLRLFKESRPMEEWPEILKGDYEKAPSIKFKPLAEFSQAENDAVISDQNTTFNRVAEPIEAYHKL